MGIKYQIATDLYIAKNLEKKLKTFIAFD